MYLPDDGNGPLPTVLLIHAAYLKKSDYAQMAEHLAEGGYAVVPISWQVSKKVVDETFCALAWVHANGEAYGFDPQRVVLFGHGFGGYQAVTLASADDPSLFLTDCPHPLPASARVKGAVTYASFFGTPQWALSAPYYRSGIATIYSISRSRVDELCETLIATPFQTWRDIDGLDDKASSFVRSIPLGWIDGSEPPIYMLHGEEDDTIAILEAEAFVSELQAAGVETKLQVLADAGHWTAGESDSPGWESVLTAIEAHLAELLR
jgi:acetyl esterase/lipase